MNIKPSFFYYLFKLFINLAGLFFGTLLGVLFFYPLMLAFQASVLIVFIEVYLIIFLAVTGARLFNKLFMNYILYKPLFYEIKLKLLFGQKAFLLSFYIFGLVFFIFFILSF